MNKKLILNRYTITFGSIALIALLLNIYVVFNDDGLVAGRVVDGAGNPVAGAKVTLFEKTLFVAQPRMNTETDENGEFMFSGHNYYRIWLEATREGVGIFPKTEFRLYFKGQNRRFEVPFELKKTQQ